MPFTSEQLRIAENLSMVYDTWLAHARRASPPPSRRLTWKTVNARDYLYEVRDRAGNATSLGPRSTRTEAMHADFATQRDAYKASEERFRALKPRMAEVAAQYRALRMPMIDVVPGQIMRELDRQGLYAAVQIAGTNCMAAYELEAGDRFATGMDSTADCDMTWCADRSTVLAVTAQSRTPIFDVLRTVDATFTENYEKPFQARNASGFEVEVLVGEANKDSFPAGERIRPIPLPEQDWLLRGRQVSQIVCDRSNMPAKLVAPDPRWMGLHKLWLANKPERNRNKIEKDWRQGCALLAAVRERMPHYPLDEAFDNDVPSPLRHYYEHFKQGTLDPERRIPHA